MLKHQQQHPAVSKGVQLLSASCYENTILQGCNTASHYSRHFELKMYRSNNYILGPTYEAGGEQSQEMYSMDKASVL